jgi:hypothetical protein
MHALAQTFALAVATIGLASGSCANSGSAGGPEPAPVAPAPPPARVAALADGPSTATPAPGPIAGPGAGGAGADVPAPGLAGASLQLRLLQGMPPGVLDRIARGGRPDGAGAVGHNQASWMGAQYQRSAALYLMDAVSRGDRRGADDAWRAVDFAFAHQDDSGGFGSRNESGAPSAMKDLYSDTAFWLAQLAQAVLVVRASPMAGVFHDRIESLIPGLRRAATFLSQGEGTLTLREAAATNRYFIDALAFELSGLALAPADPELLRRGAYFVDLGLKKQHPEGFFEEAGGADSSYNAVSILMLQIHDLYFPSARSADALASAVRWQLGRIDASGEIEVEGNARTGLGQEHYFGKAKAINYPEVTLALLYYGTRRADAAALDAAHRVYEFKFGRETP